MIRTSVRVGDERRAFMLVDPYSYIIVGRKPVNDLGHHCALVDISYDLKVCKWIADACYPGFDADRDRYNKQLSGVVKGDMQNKYRTGLLDPLEVTRFFGVVSTISPFMFQKRNKVLLSLQAKLESMAERDIVFAALVGFGQQYANALSQVHKAWEYPVLDEDVISFFV